MLGYRLSNGRLKAVDNPIEELDELVWLDLFDEPLDKIKKLEALLGVNIPTRDEMEEIEVSSRLYEENDAWFLTVTLPARAGQGEAERPAGDLECALPLVQRSTPRAPSYVR